MSAVVVEDGRVLLQCRVDNGRWALPGGMLEPGETPIEATVRETREETGLDIRVVGLVGIYADPRHVIAYQDGEVRQQFSLCFCAEPVGGQITVDRTESTQVAWIAHDHIPDLDIHPAQRFRIDDGLAWTPHTQPRLM